MTNRLPTIPEADAEMERLGWLRGAATPNREVRRLWNIAVAYRAEVHRLEDQLKEGKEGTVWTRKIAK